MIQQLHLTRAVVLQDQRYTKSTYYTIISRIKTQANICTVKYMCNKIRIIKM